MLSVDMKSEGPPAGAPDAEVEEEGLLVSVLAGSLFWCCCFSCCSTSPASVSGTLREGFIMSSLAYRALLINSRTAAACFQETY